MRRPSAPDGAALDYRQEFRRQARRESSGATPLPISANSCPAYSACAASMIVGVGRYGERSKPIAPSSVADFAKLVETISWFDSVRLPRHRSDRLVSGERPIKES